MLGKNKLLSIAIIRISILADYPAGIYTRPPSGGCSTTSIVNRYISY